MSFEPYIRKLYDDRGELTAPMVVDAARPADAPLHAFFEWDDERAAEEFRLEQARSMIRRVRFVVEHNGEPQESLREFRTVTDVAGVEPRRVYRRVSELTEAEKAEVLERMRHEIASLVRRYRDHESFWVEIRNLAA